MNYQSFLIEHPFDHVHGTHEVIEHIQRNELKVLEMTHFPEDYFGSLDEFLEALASNTSIQVVKFHDEFLDCLHNRRRRQVVAALGKLPNLQEVELADSCLLMSGITDLLKACPTLKALTLRHLVMQGLQRDFDALEKELYEHPVLKSFDMKDCQAANDEIYLSPLRTAAESAAPTAPLPPLDPPPKVRVVKRTNSAVAA